MLINSFLSFIRKRDGFYWIYMSRGGFKSVQLIKWIRPFDDDNHRQSNYELDDHITKFLQRNRYLQQTVIEKKSGIRYSLFIQDAETEEVKRVQEGTKEKVDKR